MIRKQLSIFIIILVISLLVVQPVQAAKSYYAETFDVQIDLQEGGSAIVTETVKFHFEGDPFTFAFREISARQTDGLTFLEATLDGVAMPRGTEAGQVEVEEGDPLKVTWHFPPASNAVASVCGPLSCRWRHSQGRGRYAGLACHPGRP